MARAAFCPQAKSPTSINVQLSSGTWAASLSKRGFPESAALPARAPRFSAARGGSSRLAGPMRVFDMWTGQPANREADLPSFDVGYTAAGGDPIKVLN